MLIIPAIDIKDGKCVRLTQGRMDAETVYSENPADVAKRWESLGAKLIHLVDLDGAVEGIPKNINTIKKIFTSINTPVQIGGGIRDIETIEYYLNFRAVQRIIIGTKAQETPSLVEKACKKFPERIAVGIDAKDGFVATHGWVNITSEKAIDLAKKFENMGVACIIYTDIKKDGMLQGPNMNATKEMANAVKISVIASGGVSSLSDIKALKGIKLEGVIIGKALYSGNIDLEEAIKIAKE
ncbi:MAG: 1-(5-phosphoribosyl)-5-[(5-phosphoribosylamino)methylideneamino]imidazole-4-carboxamide isomerase [Deltaproteobacteria bacterium GWC2_42_11]|nr:MAG: 1-(5-phosphoribosyl)-5-[(5-phosphoribosylamino)methylideneamino]imidazole-4-carboxamide isomerase [Deltaproteobacteria bacterium GWC2_42_11]HBO84769.1 1-(5-phosphoribosyl)-5-((5-phosphoribosylamino)methylideneamino)imidazole-4-carboxamide isomerase [Deltaproteobacteria bacterium]